MKLQMEVLNMKELRERFRSLENLVVSPQAGIADDLKRALEHSTIPNAQHRVWALFDTSGDFPRRIKARKVNQYRVDIVVDAVYAAVHEYGGTFTITPRQRRFFWAKWIETGEDMWRALALSTTYTIPARPYLRPAIDATRHEALGLAAGYLRNRIKTRFS